VRVEITDYYKSSKALELIAKALPGENPELSLIDAIRMGPIRTWVFLTRAPLRLKARPMRILIPSDLWWNLSEDLTRGDLRDQSALKVDLATGTAHLLLVDGHREHHSGELQIHKAGLTQWLNGLEKLDEGSHPQRAHKASQKQNRKRRQDVEADAILRTRIEKVLARARRKWTKKKNPGINAMANELTSTRHADLGYKYSAVKKILAGTYKSSKRLRIDGF
jgi:hypothetical protein